MLNKKILLATSVAVLFGFTGCINNTLSMPTSNTVNEDGKFEKTGFLASKWCIEKGYFTDCRLESYNCITGDCFNNFTFKEAKEVELALFVHDEGKYYNIDIGSVPRYEFDEGVNRDQVTIIGSYNSWNNTITASSYKAPPPPKKSFFKGCL